MNTMGQVVQVWLPLIVFQQIHAPRYFKGWITVSVLNFFVVFATLAVWWLYRTENYEIGEATPEGSEASEVEVAVK